MSAPDVYWGLRLVWDGQEYKRDPKYIGSWNGPESILPKTSWRSVFSLSEYQVPVDKMGAGRHTLLLKDRAGGSNTVTLFVEQNQ